MMQQLTARMVRGYKGAAASILLLLMIEQRAMTQGELRRGTGYGDEAINDAVWMLREDGLIVEAGRYTWCLPGDLRQLPIGAEVSAVDNPVDKIDKSVDNFSESVDTAPTDPELALNESINDSESIKEDDSLIDASSGISGAVTPAALRKLNFYGRGIEELLRIEGLTMAEVEWQVEHAPSLGAALARLKKRQPWDTPRAGPDGRDGYRGGQFADFVQT